MNDSEECKEDMSAGEQCIDVEGGVKIFVKSCGAGKPIMLIHGWGLNHEMWKNQVPSLVKNGYQVITIDLRGFGESSKPKPEPGKGPQEVYNYKTWAADIRTVLDTLKLQNVTLVGYSIGGAIVMSYAGLYEKNDPRIEKIVLVSAAGPCMKFDWSNNRWGLPGEFFEEAVKVFENKQIDDLFEVFHTFHRIRFKEIRGDDVEWIKGMLESASKDALVGATIAMQNCDLRQYLPEIHVSTKICHGLLDEFVHYPLAEQQQHLIPSSNIVCFEFSDHLLFLDQAKRLADELSWNMQT